MDALLKALDPDIVSKILIAILGIIFPLLPPSLPIPLPFLPPPQQEVNISPPTLPQPQQLTPLPQGIQTYPHGAVVFEGHLYVVGVTNNQTVLYSTMVNSVDGTIGQWHTLSPPVSQALMPDIHHAFLFTQNNNLFLAGATASNNTSNYLLYSAPILGDGVIGQWKTLTFSSTLTNWKNFFLDDAFAYQNKLFVLGINTDSPYEHVFTSVINSDGSLGSWTQQQIRNIYGDGGRTALPGILSGGYLVTSLTKDSKYVFSSIQIVDGRIADSETYSSPLPLNWSSGRFVVNGNTDKIYVLSTRCSDPPITVIYPYGHTCASLKTSVFYARYFGSNFGEWNQIELPSNQRISNFNGSATATAGSHLYVIGEQSGTDNLPTVFSVNLAALDSITPPTPGPSSPSCQNFWTQFQQHLGTTCNNGPYDPRFDLGQANTGNNNISQPDGVIDGVDVAIMGRHLTDEAWCANRLSGTFPNVCVTPALPIPSRVWLSAIGENGGTTVGRGGRVSVNWNYPGQPHTCPLAMPRCAEGQTLITGDPRDPGGCPVYQCLGPGVGGGPTPTPAACPTPPTCPRGQSLVTGRADSVCPVYQCAGTDQTRTNSEQQKNITNTLASFAQKAYAQQNAKPVCSELDWPQPVVSPATVAAGGNYQIRCSAGRQLDCVFPNQPNNINTQNEPGCHYVGGEQGNIGVFDCKAPQQGGAYQVGCNTSAACTQTACTGTTATLTVQGAPTPTPTPSACPTPPVCPAGQTLIHGQSQNGACPAYQCIGEPTPPPPPPPLNVCDNYFANFVAAFGSREGDKTYNILYDLNRDGDINIFDFMQYLLHFADTSWCLSIIHPVPTAADWIGLYKVGDPNDNEHMVTHKRLTDCEPSSGPTPNPTGSCTFTMPDASGNYEFRLFSGDGFTKIATSNTITVAVLPSYTITGRVFIDDNRNGVLDEGERPFGGASVGTGNSDQIAQTDQTGKYSLNNLTSSRYEITLTVPSGYQLTTPNPIRPFLLTPNTTVNFGIVQVPIESPGSSSSPSSSAFPTIPSIPCATATPNPTPTFYNLGGVPSPRPSPPCVPVGSSIRTR